MVAVSSRTAAKLARLLPLLVVVVFAVVVAALTYRAFLDVHRHLWDSSTHDRNAHYLFALRLVADIQQGRLFRLVYDLYTASIWPPLHGILAAAAMLLGGRDYRIAVLPNLIAWVGMVVLAFLAARRAAPRGGTLAGFVAVLFLVASPAHRVYATDVMLESLGACLTLAVLYAYLVAVQSASPSLWVGRWLALALTALFLHKYNYWMLCVFTIVLTELARRPLDYWKTACDTIGRVEWPAFLRAQVRSPLNYALAAVVLLVATINLSGVERIALFGCDMAVKPPHALVTLAYVLLFARLAKWWWHSGRVEIRRFDLRFQQLVYWHIAPVALWFLQPKHISNFLWFVSPANSGGAEHKTSLLDGLRYYGPRMVEEYHTAFWCAVLAGALLIPAVLLARRLRTGGSAILVLFALGLLLTATHPNHKGRYVHSWIALGWLAAGLGAAALVYGPLTARLTRLRPWLAAAALGALATALLPSLGDSPSAPEGGPHPARLSLLDVTDSYLTELSPSRRAAIVATVPIKPLAQWTFLERTGNLRLLENNWYGYGPPGDGNRQGFEKWLSRTRCDTLIFVDRLPGSGVGWEEIPEVALHAELRDLILSQQAFRLVKKQEFPRHGCRVFVWTRQEQQTAQRD